MTTIEIVHAPAPTGEVRRLVGELARAAGRPVLVLETGDRQPDALRLYRRWGFADCPPFGDYCTLPAHSIATSLFLQKPL